MQPPRPAGLVGLRRHLVVADALPLFNALLAGRLGPVAVDVQLQGHTRLLQHPQQFEAALKAYEKQSASELREALSSVQPFFLLCNAGGGADCSANPLEMSGSGTASDGHPQATPGTAMLSTSPVLYTMSPANNYPVLPLLAHLLRAQRVTKLLFHSRLLYRLLFLFLGTDRVEVSSVVDVPTWTTLGQQLRPSLALLFHVPMEGVKHLSDLMTVLPLEMQQMLNEETQSIAQQQQREQRPCDGAGSARSLDDSVPDTLEEVSTGDSDVAGCRKGGEEDELIDAVQILERIRPFAEPPLNGNKNSASGTACTDPDSDFRSAGVKHRPSRSHQRRCGRRCDSDPYPSSPPHVDMPYLADVYNGLKTVTLFFTHVLSRLIDVVDPGAAGVAEPHAGVATMPLLTSRYGSEAIESPVSALRHRLAPSEVCALRTYADFLCEIMAYHGVFVNHTMAREMLTLLDVQMAAIEELGLRVAATLLAGTEPTTFSKTLEAVESSKWNIQMVLQCLTRLHAAATTAEMPQVLDVHHLRFLSTQAKQSSDQQAAQLGLGCLLVCAWMAYLDRASMKNRLLGMFSKVSEKLHLHVLEHPRDVATADIGAAPGAPTAHAPRVCYSVHPDWVLHNKSTGRIFSALPNVQNLPKQPPRTTFQVHALSVTQGRGGSSSSSSGETPHPCGYVDPPTTEDIDGWLSLAEAGAADQASSAQFLLFPEHPEWTLRHLYCAPPGCVLISFDYNQLELRLLAHLSGDAALQEHLSANVDVLALVTASVLNLPSIDHVHPSQRQAVKVIVYGLLYGMGQELMDVRIKKINEEFAAAGRRPHREGEEPPSVAPPVSATDLLGRFYKAYPRIERYLRETRQEALRSFAVETLSGRKSLVAEADANRRKQRAIAQAVQGGAADVLQSAMRAVHERRHRFLPYLPAASLALVMSIHDELVYAVPRVATDVVVREVQRILEGQARALRLAVPLPVSVRIGHSFGELTEYRFAEA
ncbi:hypothetical protein JKF63_05567 [Porcisia hertigi]|uniref:DNA-directed DNA polymerase family A palm domain-containing protein n=1 Tax=Porcisia hertigi TaxID=2761500 RepID=A0A836IU97_9TRYP|nr:hypothetical protein JKF63_05567 [Porcisia hertigi]